MGCDGGDSEGRWRLIAQMAVDYILAVDLGMYTTAM